MDLILWRHAEAVPAREDQDDLERVLTPKGERQARRMAEWLNHRLTHSTRVLASPAVRTRKTAEALGRRFKTVEALRPDAAVEAVLEAMRWPDGAHPVLVVGHQPTLGMVAARLIGGSAQPWPMKKAAVWWLRERDRETGALITLHAVQSPDTL